MKNPTFSEMLHVAFSENYFYSEIFNETQLLSEIDLRNCILRNVTEPLRARLVLDVMVNMETEVHCSLAKSKCQK